MAAIFVPGQGPKECNEVASLATSENAEGDLINPPRLAWTVDGNEPPRLLAQACSPTSTGPCPVSISGDEL